MPGNTTILTVTSAENAQIEKWLEADDDDVPKHCEFECQCDLLFYKTANYPDGSTVELTFHAGSARMPPHAEVSVYTREHYTVHTCIIGPEGVIGHYEIRTMRREYSLDVFVDDLLTHQTC